MTNPSPTLYALAVVIALCLLVWCWATDGAPDPVPAFGYIVPVVLAGLLVLVVAAIREQRGKR